MKWLHIYRILWNPFHVANRTEKLYDIVHVALNMMHPSLSFCVTSSPGPFPDATLKKAGNGSRDKANFCVKELY